MEFNFLAIAVAAVVPILLGFIWYNPKILGIIWAREAGMTPEKMKSGNFAVIAIISLILSFLLAFFVQFLTIHQTGALGMIGGDPNLDTVLPSYQTFMDDYGSTFRTYKHGALHGFLGGLFFVLPVLGINALFERKSWKYILLNVSYWALSLTIMGAIVCGWV